MQPRSSNQGEITHNFLNMSTDLQINYIDKQLEELLETNQEFKNQLEEISTTSNSKDIKHQFFKLKESYNFFKLLLKNYDENLLNRPAWQKSFVSLLFGKTINIDNLIKEMDWQMDAINPLKHGHDYVPWGNQQNLIQQNEVLIRKVQFLTVERKKDIMEEAYKTQVKNRV